MHLILAAVLTVAAASDLQPVLPRLVAQFEEHTGNTVRVIFGSSGNFVAQIRSGAPFDVFLSADAAYPQQLESAGLTAPGTITVYATGTLVLWVRKRSGVAGVDVKRGLDALLTDRVKRIAIANPDHAPYGRAAVAALRARGIYDAVRGKLVEGENVSQAAQFVQSGNADAGLIPLSLARAAAADGEYAIIPSRLYPPIEQAAVVVRASHNTMAAREFMAYLQQPDARRVLAEAGFGLPPARSR